MPRASALIVSYNTRELLLQAIASVLEQPGIEIIVFDNASSDGSADIVAQRFPTVTLIRSLINHGFAVGINAAATRARGDALLLLNPDARLEPGALDLLLAFLKSTPPAGLVAPALRYPDGTQQAAAFRFPGLTQVFLDLFPVARLTDSRLNGRIGLGATAPLPIDHPLGACMLIRRSAWDDVGPLDEGYFMYMEEIDWARRARRRGWQIWHHPAAVAVHHGGQATRQRADRMYAALWRSRLRYYQRYSSPTYNRALHALMRYGLGTVLRSASPNRAAAIESIRRLTA